MPQLDPKDDYPDAKKDGDRRFHVLTALRAPNRAFRAWIAGSPRRSLSPSGKLAATARVETVASAPGGGHYLSRPQLRPPTGKEVGRWKILVCDAKIGWKQYVLPEGVAVTALAIGDDKGLHLALTFAPKLAKQLGLPAAEIDLPAKQVESLPQDLYPHIEPANAMGAILKRAGVAGAKVAVRAKSDATTRAKPPTEREFRAFLDGCFAKVRPALIADLRKRIFRHPFPTGTTVLAFEVFHDDLEPLPIVGYPCRVDGEPVVVEENGRLVEAKQLQVLPGHEIVPKRLANQYAGFGEEFDHGPHVMRWFVACWKEAVAKQPFPLRATIQFHDVNKPTRLPSGQRPRTGR